MHAYARNLAENIRKFDELVSWPRIGKARIFPYLCERKEREKGRSGGFEKKANERGEMIVEIVCPFLSRSFGDSWSSNGSCGTWKLSLPNYRLVTGGIV